MKIEEIQARIQEILSDERLFYPAATVFENAPLALIQYGLEVELRTLENVIGRELTNVNKIRKSKS